MPRERRPRARDPLRARQVELEECLDVLLDRHAADVQEDRRLGVQAVALLRLEDVEIDAARPQHDIRESARLRGPA